MAESCRVVSVIKMLIDLKVSLKRDEYYIDMAQLPLQSL